MSYRIMLFLALGATVSLAGDGLLLDAERTVELALEASDMARAAAARAEAAGRRADAADALRLPRIDLEASAVYRNSVPELELPLSTLGVDGFVLFPDIREAYRSGLAVNQPLWTGGAISGNRSASRHDEAAATADAARVAADLRFEARTAYWKAVAAVAALDASRSELERATRLLDDARALRAAGLALRADELGAEARQAAARVRVIDAEVEVANTRAELRSLLHVSHDTDLRLLDSGAQLPQAPPPLAELTATARIERPELAALASRREALAFRSVAAAAGARPELRLAARWETARPNERFLPLAADWNTSWSVGLVAGWRIFDGKRALTEAAAIDADRTAVSAELQELERRVVLEVANAHRILEAARAAEAAAAAAVEVAAAREADSGERYSAGVATVSEVLDAQSELAAAELVLVRARVRAWLADAGLRRAVGR